MILCKFVLPLLYLNHLATEYGMDVVNNDMGATVADDKENLEQVMEL